MTGAVHVPDWLTKAITLHHEGKVDAALDEVYGYLDDALWDDDNSPFRIGNILEPGKDLQPRPDAAAEINQLLGESFVQEAPTDVLLSIIIVTRPARKWLPNRRKFALACRETFNLRGHNGDELIKNLDTE